MSKKVLPPRPLRLAASYTSGMLFKAALWAIVGTGVLGVTLWLQGDNAVSIVREGSLMKSGAQATYVSYHGNVSSHRGMVHDHKLTVEYEDQEGRMHTGHLEFTTLFVKADKSAQPEVRYDPKDPSRFALNVAVERSGSRWALVIVALAFFGGMGLVPFLGTRKLLRDLGAARAAAAGGEELRVAISTVEDVRTQKGAPTGRKRYWYRGQSASGQPITGSVEVAKGHRPLFGDAAEGTLVALLAPGAKQAVVLRDDLMPFAFDKETAARIQREAVAPELGL